MNPKDIPQDIYNLLAQQDFELKDDGVDDILFRMGEAMKDAVAAALGPDQQKGLRLSGLGKPNRKLMHDVAGTKGEKLAGHTRVKFLFGHVLEALLVALAELAGHDVQELQKPCEVAGIPGSQDCRIDGVLTDIKSASTYGFKKFRDGTLIDDDPFGYVAQLKGYAAQEGDRRYGWLAMDKQHGHIAWLEYSEDDPRYAEKLSWSIEERAREVQNLAEDITDPMDLPPCHEPVPDGTSGNMKLAIGCSYCDYKKTCWPGVRTFLYSNGPRYLTKVVNEPRVVELREDF